MKVIKIEVGKKPYVKEISPELSSLQSEVDGHIEFASIGDENYGILCNEEGKLIGLAPNIILDYDVIVGDCFIVKYGAEAIESVDDNDINRLIDWVERRRA